jgi:hypothetical protein
MASPYSDINHIEPMIPNIIVDINKRTNIISIVCHDYEPISKHGDITSEAP